MPGGRLHSPIWTPYALYGTVDYIYGWPAWNDGVGFTAAQSAMNVMETLMYGYYLYTLASVARGTGWYKVWDKSFWSEDIVAKGPGLGLAVLMSFSGAVMTVSKTILYCTLPPLTSFAELD
jgi:hypothetical protein